MWRAGDEVNTEMDGCLKSHQSRWRRWCEVRHDSICFIIVPPVFFCFHHHHYCVIYCFYCLEGLLLFFPFTKNIFSHLIPSTLTSTFNEKLTFKSKLKKKVFSRWAVSVTLWPNHVSKQVSHIFTPKKNRKWREMWDFCKKKYKLGKRVFRTSLQKSTPLLTIYFSTNYFHRIIHN